MCVCVYLYLQCSFNGFEIVLNAFTNGARVKEQDYYDFGGTHDY
jgi:hypothetical protein